MDHKILLVDEDKHIQQRLRERLQDEHLSLIAASDASAALTLARRESPRLILLNLGLPGGAGSGL